MVIQQVLNVINGGEDLGARLTVADQNKLHLEGRREGGEG